MYYTGNYKRTNLKNITNLLKIKQEFSKTLQKYLLSNDFLITCLRKLKFLFKTVIKKHY